MSRRGRELREDVHSLVAAALPATLRSSAARAVCATPPPARRAPKLIVAISVDQLSSDLWDEYRPTVHRRAGAAGARDRSIRNGYQGHAATETCPGHSTILTGSRPARTGIIAKAGSTSRRRAPTRRSIAPRTSACPARSSTSYTVSPVHLKVADLGELMKRAVPASRNVAVAGKDRSAVMMGGHVADQRWYWNGKTFVTDLQRRGGPAQPRRGQRRRRRADRRAAGRRCDPPPLVRRQVARRAASKAAASRSAAGAFARAAGDASAFRASPAFDGATLALAAGLFQEMQLGRGHRDRHPRRSAWRRPIMSATATAPAGRRCACNCCRSTATSAISSACSTARGVDYAVVADRRSWRAGHSRAAARSKGVADAARVDPALAASAVGKAIGAKLGLTGPVLIGESSSATFISTARSSPPTAPRVDARRGGRLPRPPAGRGGLHQRRRLRPHAVADRRARTNGPLIERARASFDPTRSGDLHRPAEAATSPRSAARAVLCRDPRQPVGL